MAAKTSKDKSASTSRQLSATQLISRIGQVFASNKSLETTLAAIVNLVRTTLQLERCSIMLLEREQGLLRMAAAAGIPEALWNAIQTPVGEGISGKVVYERKPVLVEDISTSEFAHAAHHERYSTRSFISVPIMARGEVVGVLNANSCATAPPLDRRDLELMVAIATFAGLAIENLRLARAASESGAWLSSILDALPCAALIVDRNLAVRLLNKEARRWLGVPTDVTFAPRPLLDLWPELEGTPLLGKLREALASATKAFFVESLRFPRNVSAEHEITISPVQYPYEERPLVLLTLQDILSSAALDSYRSQFLALLAHELRTPFTAIQAASQLLLRAQPAQNADWSDMLRIVSANSQRLLTVVNSLLDLHDLERQALALEPSEFELSDLVDGIVQSFQPDARQKALVVETDGEPLHWFADPRRVGQMLAALLDNAIKFSPPASSIRIFWRLRPDHSLAISVQDAGPGIPEEVLLTLETRFRQAETVTSRSNGGLGVGLFLARSLARLHGGELLLESPPTGGTVATIVLPPRPE